MAKQYDQVLTKLTKIESLLEATTPAPMTLAQAALYLCISRSTLYRMTSHSQIRHFKPNGKRVYFLKADLDKWIVSKAVREVEQ